MLTCVDRGKHYKGDILRAVLQAWSQAKDSTTANCFSRARHKDSIEGKAPIGGILNEFHLTDEHAQIDGNVATCSENTVAEICNEESKENQRDPATRQPEVL